MIDLAGLILPVRPRRIKAEGQVRLTAMMSAQLPESEQGTLQGGLGAVSKPRMLAGVLFFAPPIGYFLSDAVPRHGPVAGCFPAALMVPFAMVWSRKDR